MFGVAASGPRRILETKIRTIHEISLCGGDIYAYFIGPGNYLLQRNTPKSLIIHLRVVSMRKGSSRVCGISILFIARIIGKTMQYPVAYINYFLIFRLVGI